jgi:hypothetical protein
MNTYAKRGANDMEVNFKGSNQHELIKLFLFFQLDRTTYRINDVALNSAEVDFSIDGIASITWNGQGASIDEVPHDGGALDTTTWVATTDYTSAFAVHTGGVEAKFIKNKLSSITLKKATGTTSGAAYANFAGALDPAAVVDYDGTNTYEVTITVDGGTAQTLSIDSSGNYTHKPTLAVAGSTVKDALNELNYQLKDAIIYFDEGDVRIASSSSGTTSSIAVADDATYPAFEDLDTSAFVEFKQANNSTAYAGAVSGTGSVKTYNVPITGGSLTIENNITYLTPEELGKVNVPIGSFTGTRSITGSVTAYLNTGSTNTAGLLTDLAAATDTVTHEFEMKLSMGGGANTPRVDFIMNHAHLVIPSINVEDVLSTEISFTGLAEEIDAADELVVRYVSPTV